LVGFALEDQDLRANAERKMREKHLDVIVANTPGAIGADTSTVCIKVRASEWTQIVSKTKPSIAKMVISMLEGGRAK
jgi:phosphopantothenoylcysteine synthetase/decarboxylase